LEERKIDFREWYRSILENRNLSRLDPKGDKQ